MKYNISGKTFEKKELLKKLGCYWDASGNRWSILNPSKETIDKIFDLGLYAYTNDLASSRTSIPLTHDMVYPKSSIRNWVGD